LIQAINNLISNAIYSYHGKEGIIELVFEADKSHINISVKDRGCGVRYEVQEHLFKRMVTTKGKNGTGLGLYISYSAIKGYFSGDITFESTEGIGTKFIISIPNL
jgi:signal transduction histidine kinase